ERHRRPGGISAHFVVRAQRAGIRARRQTGHRHQCGVLPAIVRPGEPLAGEGLGRGGVGAASQRQRQRNAAENRGKTHVATLTLEVGAFQKPFSARQDSIGRRIGVCSVPVFQKAFGALRGPVFFAALAGFGVGCGSSGTVKVTKVAVSTQKTGNLAFYLDVRNNGKPVPGLVEKDFKVYEDGKLVPPKKGKRALLDADVVSANFTIIQVDLSGPMADSEYLSDLAETVTHFAADLNERQEVAVNVFDGNDEVAPFLAFGAGKEQFRNLAEGIRKFRPRNRNSHLYGAVYPGISALEEKLAATAVSEKQATLVVFTDRGELAHTVGIEQMKEKLKGTNVQIYLIGV